VLLTGVVYIPNFMNFSLLAQKLLTSTQGYDDMAIFLRRKSGEREKEE
jgi:hypothetical protein